ncbi:MAG TPA: thiamine-phosphate kinase [Candidatus Kapabacteria bacterium]|nr:thiamine-phosphate kinase [Candidatus Kapabacteria bacterium]
MNEFDLIARIAPSLATNDQLVRGVGDDCAVLDLGLKHDLLLFKTDAVVENVHFTSETPAVKVGRKALARPLSDIAAAAGKPVSCLVTLGLPKDFDPAYVLSFYSGLNELARQYNVSVAGGETTRTTGPMFASIALLGTVPRSRVITRSGAQLGDAIFVSGELGGSLAGRHLDFEPRLAEAQFLAENFTIHSMMDLSDGLAGDLRHILNASKVGAELFSDSIPITRAAKLKARNESSAKPPLLAALTDGEDYELVFTLASKSAVAVLDAWNKQFPKTKLSCIGKITSQPGLRLRDKLGIRELPAHGYTHFQKS